MTSDYKLPFPVDLNGLEDMTRRLLEPVPPTPPPASSASGIVTLDAVAAEKGATKTQNQWIEYWNAITDGRYFASAADIYAAGKTGNTTLLASLKKDFKESWIITSTRIEYDLTGATGVGKITHYYGSTIRVPMVKTIIIPAYNNTTVDEVVQGASGLQYLQTLFTTTDTAEQIMQTLETLGGKQRSEIKVYTPDQNARKSVPQRAVRFDLGSGGFHVDGDDHVGGNVGRSHGVRG